ncbi:flagellar hook-basal body complex protein [Pseudoruegeria sp. SK021]|uniref:flagellar hook-basal body complex protein n=1 Tax=Pseudoruegeria sp. SK021 TaxID=1933035 RepID=UPI000A237587|nr:flagellar hook-basal body complex protein [Pseudoruegeria sp. SK021]OSP54748.1 flagellar biosynthesis protein FlgF [Pseudoruegeria sp. SK021]
MDNANYAILTRQSGLRNEMSVIAQNIANIGTDGFQKEGLIFSEFVSRLENADSSLSMATAKVRMFDRSQGQLTQTNGQFDLAIEGEGYFLVETQDGQALTRAGSFAPGPEGSVMASDGARLLDAGGAPVVVPPDALSIMVSADGTLSADGVAIAQIGLVMPADPTQMVRAGGVRFTVEGETIALEDGQIVQGFLEASNVDPILEIARMIDVQRAYEAGRNLLNSEDERIRSVVQTLGNRS